MPRISNFKGKKHTAEAKLKNRLSHLGKTSPRKGKKLSKEQVDKMRIILASFVGERAHRWKGDSVGYASLHRWIMKHFVPRSMICEFCSKFCENNRKIHSARNI